jgi:hypothetical protein
MERRWRCRFFVHAAMPLDLTRACAAGTVADKPLAQEMMRWGVAFTYALKCAQRNEDVRTLHTTTLSRAAWKKWMPRPRRSSGTLCVICCVLRAARSRQRPSARRSPAGGQVVSTGSTALSALGSDGWQLPSCRSQPTRLLLASSQSTVGLPIQLYLRSWTTRGPRSWRPRSARRCAPYPLRSAPCSVPTS